MDERGRAIVSRKIAIQERLLTIPLTSRIGCARSGAAVSAPSRKRTSLEQHFASPHTLFITRAQSPEQRVSQNARRNAASLETPFQSVR
jgi:hypothetical protein